MDVVRRRREERRRRREQHERIVHGAAQVCTDNWRDRVTHQANAAVPVALRKSAPWACRPWHCRDLAAAARSLLRLKKWTHVGAGDLVLLGWQRFRPDTYGGVLAKHLTEAFPLPTDVVLTRSAECLRALGIVCCLGAGRDLARCRCLRDLAAGLTGQELRDRLGHLAEPSSWPSSSALLA
jgi:hypothetical protein